MEKTLFEELKDCIRTIEEIGWSDFKDSDDYENADNARNRAFEIINLLEKNA